MLLAGREFDEFRKFLKPNESTFDFSGLDNGIPVHKYMDDYPEFGGHANHKFGYNDEMEKKILKILKNPEIDELTGMINYKRLDKEIIKIIEETRTQIIKDVIKESKKIKDIL